jgi:hypothetical protein
VRIISPKTIFHINQFQIGVKSLRMDFQNIDPFYIHLTICLIQSMMGSCEKYFSWTSNHNLVLAISPQALFYTNDFEKINIFFNPHPPIVLGLAGFFQDVRTRDFLSSNNDQRNLKETCLILPNIPFGIHDRISQCTRMASRNDLTRKSLPSLESQ